MEEQFGDAFQGNGLDLPTWFEGKIHDSLEDARFGVGFSAQNPLLISIVHEERIKDTPKGSDCDGIVGGIVGGSLEDGG